MSIPTEMVVAAIKDALGRGQMFDVDTVRPLLEAAEPAIRADERARLLAAQCAWFAQDWNAPGIRTDTPEQHIPKAEAVRHFLHHFAADHDIPLPPDAAALSAALEEA